MQIQGQEATAVARRYLQGQGDVMALAMARLAGLPLGLWAGIRDSDGDDNGETEILPAHAVVLLDAATQRWADVNGIQQGVPDGLVFDRPVDRVALLPATEADVRQAFTVDAIDEDAIAAAIAFARTGAPVAGELDALRRAGAALPPAEAAPPAPLLGPGSPAFARWFRASKIVGPDGAPLRVFHGTKVSFDVFESMAPTTVFRLDGEEVLRADSWDVDGDWERLPERFHYGALTDAVTLGPEAALAMREREAARYVADGLDPDTLRRLRDLKRMLGRTLTQHSESRVTGDGFYFTPDLGYSFVRDIGRHDGGNVMPCFLSIQNPVFLNAAQIEGAGAAFNVETYRAQGYDGAIFADYPEDLTRRGWGGATQIVAFEPTQIKSAIGNRGTYSLDEPDIRFSRTSARRLAPETAASAEPAPRKKDALRDAAFDAWFGASKAIDADGLPLVLYHGSPDGGFTVFSRDDAAISPATQKASDDGLGFFFTDSRALAEQYRDRNTDAPVWALGGPSLYAVHLSLQNPFVTREALSGADRWRLEQEGYDGVIYDMAGWREYVAFHPTQIKSLANVGTYDAANPDIRFSRTSAARLAAQPDADPAADDRTQDAVREAAFDAWFRDSQVIDDNHAPRVVYHGTASAVDAFHGKVTWVSATRDLANAYATVKGSHADGGANIMPLYASIRKPLDLGPLGNHLTLAALREKVGFDFAFPAALADLPEAHLHPVYRVINTPEFIDAAIAAGYDGLFGYEGGRKTWGAFSPTALKSAIGNRGTYDAQDPDVRFSRKHRFISIPRSALADLRPISIEHALSLVAGKTEKPGGVDPVRQFGTGDEPHARLNWFGRVPLTAFVENEEGELYDGTVNRERAQAYAQRSAEDVPPVLAVIGRRSGMLNILDGGHRLSAARMRGDTDIAVILRLPPDIELCFEGPALAAQAEPPMPAAQPSEAAVGVSADAVLAALEDDLYAHHVDVYGTFAELPDYIRKQARGECDAGVEGFWDPRRNRVGLVAEFLSSPERARQVARHELVGHYGLETMLGPDGVASVTAMVMAAERAGNAVVRGFGARVDTEQPGLPDPRRALEIVAMMAEDNVHNNGIMRRVADGMRVFLSRIGFLKSDVTDARLCALLRDSQRYVRNLQTAIAPPSTTTQPDRARTYYGSIGAKERDAALLASMGVELGPYDPATGRFPARFGEQANTALQDFPEDFVVSAIPVRHTAEVGHRGPREQDEAWLMERRAVLDWHLSAANQTVPREALLGAEMQSVESALQALKAAVRPMASSPSGDGLAPA